MLKCSFAYSLSDTLKVSDSTTRCVGKVTYLMQSYCEKSDEVRALLEKRDVANLLRFAEQLWREGFYDDAIFAFRGLVELRPEDGSSLLALAKAESNFYYDEKTFLRLEQYCKLHPENGNAVHFLSQAQLTKVNHGETLTRSLTSLEKSPDCRPLQLFYQSLLVLKGMQPADSLKCFADNPRDISAIQSLLLCNRAKTSARVFGLPMEMLRFFAKHAPTDGLVIECGVYFGKSIRVLADEIARPIHGFDSFQGLPESWKPGEPEGSYSTHGKLPSVPAHVQLHQGWFEATLPKFVEDNPGKISLLHIDCDLYSSTKTILECCRQSLGTGTIIIFDDLLGYPGWEQHEWRAFMEFTQTHSIQFRFVGFVLLGREVAVEII